MGKFLYYKGVKVWQLYRVTGKCSSTLQWAIPQNLDDTPVWLLALEQKYSDASKQIIDSKTWMKPHLQA